MILTDDPIKDAMRYDWEQEEKINKLPICEECGEHIQDEGYYEINGCCYHKQCLYDNYWRWNDD